jgi:hypothetical protein
MTSRRQRRRARQEAKATAAQQRTKKIDTLRKLGANMSGCGCFWRRDPVYGDVLSLTCDIHTKGHLVTDDEQKRATLERFGVQCCEKCHAPIREENRGTQEVDLSGERVGRVRDVLCKSCQPALVYPCRKCGKPMIALCLNCLDDGAAL